jgi:chromosome partitioning protein
MHVIGILNTKGGCGKTTLTTCLAVRAAGPVGASLDKPEARVAVVDLDPQSSYSDWYARRGSPDNPALLTGEDRASDAVEALRLTSPYDYVFVDGPTNALLITEDAIKASTFVIIPMKASGLDLSASQDCISLCQELRAPFLVVINDKGQHDGKLVDEATKLLTMSWKVPVAKTVISHRVPYINAITTGKTGPEKDKKAAEEIDELWAEIRASVRKAAKARAA